MLMLKRYGKWCAGYWQVCASYQMTLNSLYLAFALAPSLSLSLSLSLCLYDLSNVSVAICAVRVSCLLSSTFFTIIADANAIATATLVGVRVFVVWLKSTHNNFCLWKLYVRARAFNEYSLMNDERWPANESQRVSIWLCVFLLVFQLYAKHDASASRFSIDTLKFKRSICRFEGILFITENHELNDICSSSRLWMNLTHSNLLISRCERKPLHHSIRFDNEKNVLDLSYNRSENSMVSK